jgi:hypothetical protein
MIALQAILSALELALWYSAARSMLHVALTQRSLLPKAKGEEQWIPGDVLVDPRLARNRLPG